jgi:uncharacterized protein YjbI with pentapeptide repeats
MADLNHLSQVKILPNSQQTLIEDYSGHNWDVDAASAVEEIGVLAASEADSPVVSQSADLSEADLQAADLSHADLTGSNLSKANLRQARLDRANLEDADLRGADLRSTHLSAARVAGAKLYGALFDQWTDLPFTKQDALRLGMVYLELTPEN